MYNELLLKLQNFDESDLLEGGEYTDRFTTDVRQLIVGHPRDAALGLGRYMQV